MTCEHPWDRQNIYEGPNAGNKRPGDLQYAICQGCGDRVSRCYRPEGEDVGLFGKPLESGWSPWGTTPASDEEAERDLDED